MVDHANEKTRVPQDAPKEPKAKTEDGFKVVEVRDGRALVEGNGHTFDASVTPGIELSEKDSVIVQSQGETPEGIPVRAVIVAVVAK